MMSILLLRNVYHAIELKGWDDDEKKDRFLVKFFGEPRLDASAIELLLCLKHAYPSIYRYSQLRRMIALPMFSNAHKSKSPDAVMARRFLDNDWGKAACRIPLFLHHVCVASKRIAREGSKATYANLMSLVVDQLLAEHPELRRGIFSLGLKKSDKTLARKPKYAWKDPFLLENLIKCHILVRKNNGIEFLNNVLETYLMAEYACVEAQPKEFSSVRKSFVRPSEPLFLLFAAGLGGNATDYVEIKIHQESYFDAKCWVDVVKDSWDTIFEIASKAWVEFSMESQAKIFLEACHAKEYRLMKLFSSQCRLEDDDGEYIECWEDSVTDSVQTALNDGDLENVKILIHALVNEQKFRYDYTFVRHAAGTGNMELLKYIVDLGLSLHDDALLDPFVGPIPEAIFEGNIEAALFLIRKGTILDAYPENPMVAAALMGETLIARYLLRYGESANHGVKKVLRGGIPIIEAARFCHVEMVNLLLDWGANPHEIDREDGWSVLMYAAALGNPQLTQRLISLGVDVNHSAPPHFLRALHLATGCLEVVSHLVLAGAEVDALSAFGDTALMCAARGGQSDVVEYLLKCGANIHCVNVQGMGIVSAATSYGHLCVLYKLLELGHVLFEIEGNFAECSQVKMAANCGRVDILEFLLGNGYSDQDNGALLVNAASRGDLDVVQVLVRHGVDVNSRFEEKSALYKAASGGEFEVVRLLLDNGADDIRSAVAVACISGHLEVAKLLFSRGASIRRSLRRDLMYEVCLKGWLEMAKLLVSHGVKVSAKMSDDSTLLHAASMSGSVELLAYLLDQGLDLYDETDQCLIPAHVATSCSVLEFFFSKGVSIDFNSCSISLLENAVSSKSEEIVKFLIERGASTRSFPSPLSIAHVQTFFGSKSRVKLLLKYAPHLLNDKSGGITPLDVAYLEIDRKMINYLDDAGGDFVSVKTPSCSQGHVMAASVQVHNWNCAVCDECTLAPLSYSCYICSTGRMCLSCSKSH